MVRLNGVAKAHDLLALVIAALSLITLVAPVRADTTTFTIDPQDLSGALKAFAVQSHREIFFAPELARGRTSKGVKGKYDDLKALNIILEGTGLDFSVTTSDAILVRDPASNSGSSPASMPATTSANNDPANPAIRMTQRESTPTQDATGNANSPSSSSSVSSDSEKPKLNEIIVTAQKRSERLQDVPIPVTAIRAEELVERNQVQLQDYYTRIPGLNITPSTQSEILLSIRGVTTGSGNPTVGITVDDVPYGSSTALAGGLVVPDLDPGDLARVEVLRGPQGTLYGASSMGGLLKFVTVDPSTDGVSGHVQAGTSSVYNGAELGYSFRGSVNVPISDTIAIRASGFTRQDPGYIDNPVLHLDGINEQRVYGGRLAALWRPSDVFSLKLSALFQETRGDGSNDVDTAANGYVGPALGDLQQNYVRGAGAYERKTEAYNATVTAKFGNVDLTAVSGFNVNSFADSFDYTSALGQCCTLPQFGVTGTPAFENNKTDKFTQEVRLSVPVGQRLEWLVGAFYAHENSPYLQNVFATNPTTGEIVGRWVTFTQPSTYAEYAAFTDVTFHVTDRFDVQVGGRESRIRQTYMEVDDGPYFPVLVGIASPHIVPKAESSANALTYLVTPRFKVSSDFMVYARLASGYRAGGPNQFPGGVVPAQYNPDKTQNYELGVKGDFLDHTFSVDASLYYIDWKGIQLQLFNPQTQSSYYANGSRAKSQGVEVSVESRPLTGLTIAAWVALNDAKLTEALPPVSVASGVYGADGDRLPLSSRFSANVSLDQEFPVTGSVTGSAGASVSYAGDREGDFTATAQRQSYPAYARTDLHTGMKYATWTINLFVNNVADRRGVLTGGLGYFPVFAFQYIQPRTIGVSASKAF